MGPRAIFSCAVWVLQDDTMRVPRVRAAGRQAGRQAGNRLIEGRPKIRVCNCTCRTRCCSMPKWLSTLGCSMVRSQESDQENEGRRGPTSGTMTQHWQQKKMGHHPASCPDMRSHTVARTGSNLAEWMLPPPFLALCTGRRGEMRCVHKVIYATRWHDR